MTIDGSAGGDLFLTGGLIDLKNDGSAVSQIKFYCESSNAHAQTLIGAPHSESATNTLTLPSTGGNSYLLTAASTATLTNKTLTSPKINEDVAVTATATEINLIDGGATVGTTAVADGDGILHNDGGTMRVTSATTLKTYMSDLTLTTAAQGNVTSLGTLTALTVDNITINGNDISSTAGTDLTITPLSGQQIVLDGTIVVDAGVVTGATSITSTAFVGDITGDVTGTADVATVATTVTITDNESTNESNALIFTAGGDVDGGNIGLESDGTLTYNPSTGKVTATGFVGALTGAVTGNVVGNLTGTVATATQNSITTATGLVSVGALNSGTITSGFGNIDTGSSTITTTGAVATGALTTTGASSVTDDLILNSDSAAITFGAGGDHR